MDDFVFRIKHVYRPYEETRVSTGHSVIYKAQDLNLKKDVCIKEVHISGERPEEVRRNLDEAMKEARTMVQVSERTPAVPAIHLTYFDENKKTLYIVMDWVSGDTLDKYMGDGSTRARDDEFLGWIEELCDILGIMADLRIFHKDIKPENIIIDHKKKLHLLDFNISASLPNKLEGTASYKAPEMETSATVKRDKSDIFSIGIIMYQYFCRKLPQKGREYGQKSVRRSSPDWEFFIQPRDIDPLIPGRINNIIMNCMQKNPEIRMNIYQLKKNIFSAKKEVGRRGKEKQGRHPQGTIGTAN